MHVTKQGYPKQLGGLRESRDKDKRLHKRDERSPSHLRSIDACYCYLTVTFPHVWWPLHASYYTCSLKHIKQNHRNKTAQTESLRTHGHFWPSWPCLSKLLKRDRSTGVCCLITPPPLGQACDTKHGWQRV